MRPSLRPAPRKTPARRFYGSLLLAFILVFAQQGEWKHELSHLAEPPAASQKQAPVQPEHCPLCFAFAHLASAAKTEIFAPQLLAGLKFHYARPPRVASAQTAALPPRNRGPPDRPCRPHLRSCLTKRNLATRPLELSMKYFLAATFLLCLSACTSVPTIESSLAGRTYRSGPTSADDPRLLQPHYYTDEEATPQWMKEVPHTNK